MAKSCRKPPSPSDNKDLRSYEYFFQDIFDQNSLTGTKVFDLPSLASGAVTSITIPVTGAKADKQQTVEYGLPSSWNVSLQVSAAFVSADNTVTLVIRNPTGGSIDMGSATYSARVRP